MCAYYDIIIFNMTDKGKKELPNVTLITVDCVNLSRSKTAADICEKNFTFAKTVILSSIKDDDPRVIYIPKIDSRQIYSEFYIKELWKYVDTDFALTFHPDGFILNPSAWTDEFLNYYYIGAPWYHIYPHRVGNGGFAIRSRRLLKFVSENYREIGGTFDPEDFWVCGTARPFLEKEDMKFAPLELASQWSKEGGLRGVMWNGEFGWHGLNYTDISRWLEKNPEYKAVFPQKLDDFTTFMRKYPVYDETVHVLQCKPIQVEHYKMLSRGERDYDCRMDNDLQALPPIKPGHKIVYKLFRISLQKVGVPTFERTVNSVEKFTTKKELVLTHPEIKISPTFYVPKWKQRLIAIFGNIIFPDNVSYTLILFDKN